MANNSDPKEYKSVIFEILNQKLALGIPDVFHFTKSEVTSILSHSVFDQLVILKALFTVISVTIILQFLNKSSTIFFLPDFSQHFF